MTIPQQSDAKQRAPPRFMDGTAAAIVMAPSGSRRNSSASRPTRQATYVHCSAAAETKPAAPAPPTPPMRKPTARGANHRAGRVDAAFPVAPNASKARQRNLRRERNTLGHVLFGAEQQNREYDQSTSRDSHREDPT